ncbi:hypothetical protein MLD38_018033 [Melastoma candidum]|nr:hypothetical protein MLD38_018033 [Melastoma candidum]
MMRQPSGHDAELAFISSVKSCASLRCGERLHCSALKLGILVNPYVVNSLMNMYAKCGSMRDAEKLFGLCGCRGDDVVSGNIMISGFLQKGRLWDAYRVFVEMPVKWCVSYTTMIMGFTRFGYSKEAIRAFLEMRRDGVVPNEVTLGSVISTWVNVGDVWCCRMIHGMAIKMLLNGFVVVSTNVMNMYCVCMSLDEGRRLFEEMPERNIVTWNAMLNGYSKAGLVDLARELFERFPGKDVISWGTMIGAYVQVKKLADALLTYQEMVRSGVRANDVLFVDLVAACGRTTAFWEGQQLHGMIVRSGFHSHEYVQAALIYLYSACGRIDLACFLYESGLKDHVSSANALIAGFVKNGLLDRARIMFDGMSERDVFTWTTLISAYEQNEQPETALELFHQMMEMEAECCPNEVTMTSVFSAVASLGSLMEGRLAHEFVKSNAIMMSDNLSAAMINMYAKCGSIESALEVFSMVRDKASDVSPWNAMICSLAMHGQSDLSLQLFSDLKKRNIEMNAITFVGVLTACCHSGMIEEGKLIFRSMKDVHMIEPDIAHYSCIVDMFGRAGRIEEAEELIGTMPMEPDVAVWGALLAACRTHGAIDVAEKAANNLLKLQPSHGPSRVLLSNIYANAGRWRDALSTREIIRSQQLKKFPGRSGIV